VETGMNGLRSSSLPEPIGALATSEGPPIGPDKELPMNNPISQP